MAHIMYTLGLSVLYCLLQTAQSIKNERVLMGGGEFMIGVNDQMSRTGEYPPRPVHVDPFYIDKYPVTTAEFERFQRLKFRYTPTSIRKGHSWVFESRANYDQIVRENETHPEGPWWASVHHASWSRPFGLYKAVEERAHYPVVHVSFQDAYAYCIAMKKRLPSEPEWEFAARGGRNGHRYAWGDVYKKNRMNVWQGKFPDDNKKSDGWDGVSPVDAFPQQNSYGMYDMLGNVWEWTSSSYIPPVRLGQTPNMTEHLHVVKGGSFLDSKDGTVGHEARCSARNGYPGHYTAENVGFRCAEDYVPSSSEDEDTEDEEEDEEDEEINLWTAAESIATRLWKMQMVARRWSQKQRAMRQEEL